MQLPRMQRAKPTGRVQVKENNSKCVGVCRNPQNVPGPLIFPHDMQTPEDAVRLQVRCWRRSRKETSLAMSIVV